MTDLQILIGNKMTNSQIRHTTVQLMSYNCKKHNINCVEMHLLEIKFKASFKSSRSLSFLSPLLFPQLCKMFFLIYLSTFVSFSICNQWTFTTEIAHLLREFANLNLLQNDLKKQYECWRSKSDFCCSGGWVPSGDW